MWDGHDPSKGGRKSSAENGFGCCEDNVWVKMNKTTNREPRSVYDFAIILATSEIGLCRPTLALFVVYSRARLTIVWWDGPSLDGQLVRLLQYWCAILQIQMLLVLMVFLDTDVIIWEGGPAGTSLFSTFRFCSEFSGLSRPPPETTRNTPGDGELLPQYPSPRNIRSRVLSTKRVGDPWLYRGPPNGTRTG